MLISSNVLIKPSICSSLTLLQENNGSMYSLKDLNSPGDCKAAYSPILSCVSTMFIVLTKSKGSDLIWD